MWISIANEPASVSNSTIGIFASRLTELISAPGFDDDKTIFLHSDGGPSAGRVVAMEQIRSAVKVQNRERRVRINTILIGGSAREQDFMRKLAGENDGEVGRPDADERTR